MFDTMFFEQSNNSNDYYAQILIVVTLIVVTFFGFLDITRPHEVRQVPGVVEMNPTGLPELF